MPIHVKKELQIPIQWIGTGEGAEDLERFDPENYVSALLS